jgi:hypothetical protein
LKQKSITSRSRRRAERQLSRTSLSPQAAAALDGAALQVFVFRLETFVGTEVFDARRPVTVGRGAHADLRLDGDTISRVHCQVRLEGDAVLVDDLGSGNGTFVNRQRVAGPARVRSSDAICLGPFTLKIRPLLPAGARPADPALADATTRIEGILTAEQTGGTAEVPVDLDLGLDRRLYEEALRRSTGAEVVRRPGPAAALGARLEPEATERDASPQARGDDDSAATETPIDLDAEPILQSRPAAAEAQARAASSMLSSAQDDGAAERLRDLDALLAELEAREHGPRPTSRLPWSASRPNGAGDLDVDAPATQPGAELREAAPRPMTTRELARDLASQLALDGALLPSAQRRSPAAASAVPFRATVGPAASAPAPASPLDADDEDTQAASEDEAARLVELARNTPSKALLAALPADGDEPPETDLLERPPARSAPVTPARAEPPPLPAVSPSGPPAAAAPPPLPARRPSPSPAAQPAPAAQPPPLPARRAPLAEPPRGAEAASPAAHVAAARRQEQLGKPREATTPEPAPQPARRRGAGLEARLMTPTGLRVEVSPKPAPDAPARDDSLSSEVWSSPSPQPSAQAGGARRVTEARPRARLDSRESSREADLRGLDPAYFDGVEITARAHGQQLDVAVLRAAGEQYILGHATPQGAIAPARAHLGLRLVRINPDRTVDLVFPGQVGGHLMRGEVTVAFSELAEGRKYSCLRLETSDVVTVILGEGKDATSYHVRFLRRAKSMVRSLRRAQGSIAPQRTR